MILDADDLDDESKPLLVGDEEETNELMNSGKLPVDGTDNKKLHSTCSRFNDDIVTLENEAEELKPDEEESTKSSQVPENTSHGNVQEGEDLIAKDLLCFAWQIARGMVSTA